MSRGVLAPGRDRPRQATDEAGTTTLHDRIVGMHAEMTAWRRDIHAHPELGFEERRTSALVADRLQSWGIEARRGIGRPGVVGVLRVGQCRTSVGLRADMDALPLQGKKPLPTPVAA